MRGVLALSAGLALAFAGCGDSARGLLTETQADELRGYVEAADAAFELDPPRCDDARAAARDGEREARQLPRRVDRELRENLIAWFEHLDQEARRECRRREEQRQEETPTPTPTPTEEPEESPTPEPTEEPQESPTPTPTATVEPTPTPTTDSGGVEPPDGGGVG